MYGHGAALRLRTFVLYCVNALALSLRISEQRDGYFVVKPRTHDEERRFPRGEREEPSGVHIFIVAT